MPPDFGPRRFSTDSVTSAMCKRSSAPFSRPSPPFDVERGATHMVLWWGFVLRNQRVGRTTEQVQITNQAAAEDGSRTHSTFMDPRLYVAPADGAIHVLQQCVDIHVQLTPKRTQEGHLIVVENLIEAAKQLHGDTERGYNSLCGHAEDDK
ncbi:hypothetical protein AAG906_012475 [Vitis piasezkii]